MNMRQTIATIILLMTAHVSTAEEYDQFRISIKEWIKLRKEVTIAEENWQKENTILQAEHDALKARTDQIKQQNELLQKEKRKLDKEYSAQNTKSKDLILKLSQASQNLTKKESDQAAINNLLMTGKSPEKENSKNNSLSTTEQFLTRLESLIKQDELAKEKSLQIWQKQIEIEVPNSGKRIVDVLLLGISNAFAVTTDNTNAAKATAGPNGWNWEWNPKYVQNFRAAIEEFKDPDSPGIIDLPLEVAGGK